MEREFNVIIENNGKFEPYNIMRYLKNAWERFIEYSREINHSEHDESDYWKYPESFEEIRNWVDREIKYQYWSRCEYEIILSPWPSRENDNGETIIRDGEGKKIDIYWQCKMNLDIITTIFIEDIYSNTI